MNDIDFDELDKAVSNLMGGVDPAREKDENEPKQKTLSISSTLEPGQSPTYNKLDEVAKSIGDETLATGTEAPVVSAIDDTSLGAAVPTIGEPAVTVPKPTNPEPVTPAKKRDALVTPRNDTGRFMDVMHSSSDMRTGPKNDMLGPVSQTEGAEVTEEASVVATPEQGGEQPGVAKEAPAPAESLSPFLADTKVEKRPLGTPPVASVASEPTTTLPTEPQEPPKEEEATPEIEPITEDAPEEIIAINSDVPKKQDDMKDTQEAIDPTKIELQDDESRQLQVIESSEAMTTTPSSQIANPDGTDGGHAASVMVDQSGGSTGAIYDTQEYHQPLGHPTKKKSGWGLVVVIVVIIVLAAALGAAAYFILGLGV